MSWFWQAQLGFWATLERVLFSRCFPCALNMLTHLYAGVF